MKKKILCICMLVSVITALIVFVSATVVIYVVGSNNVKKSVTDAAHIYSDMLQDGLAPLYDVEDFGSMRLTVVNAAGQVVFESDTDSIEIDHADREEIKNAFAGDPKVVTRYSRTMGCNMVYYAVTVDVGGERYALRVAERASNINDYLWTTIPFVFLAMVAALAISYIVSRKFSASVTGRLRAVGAAIRSINEGDYRPIEADTGDLELYGILNETNALCDTVSGNMKELRNERAKLRFVLDNVSQAVLALDAEGRIAFTNARAAELFGSGDAVGKDLKWLIDDEELRSKIAELVNSGAEGYFDCKTDGRYLGVKVSDTSGAGLSGDNIRYLVTVADISQEKAAIKEKSEFFANASHELKTPLTSMQGLSELLLARNDNDARQTKYLERICSESKRLNNLVLDMLYISNMENGNTAENRENIRLAPLAEEIGAEHSAEIEKKKLTFTVEGDCEICADARSMRELIGNLCSNAVNYNVDGGKVTVRLGEEDGFAVVSVEDTGIGIAEENIPKLCGRFYRVDKSRSKKTGGTGLGLAIVKHVCALYSAEMSIESEVGKGTRVTVRIPSGNME